MNRIRTTAVTLVGLLMAAALVISSAEIGNADLATEKPRIVGKIEEKMQGLIQKNIDEKETGVKYTPEKYGMPYNLVFEDDGKVVVGIDANKAIEFEKRYGEDEIKMDLETKADLEVRYYVVMREANVRGGDALGTPTAARVDQTITLVRNGKIIATDHNERGVGDIVYAGIPGNVNCKEVRIDIAQPQTGNRTSDAVYGTDRVNRFCDHNYVENSIKYNGNIYSVSDGTAGDIRWLARIYAAGAITGGSTGYIVGTGAVVSDGTTKLINQALGTYRSQDGDSGAPVFVITGPGSAKIIGQHAGTLCYVEELDGRTEPVRFCDYERDSTVKFFSTWPDVKSTLGL